MRQHNGTCVIMTEIIVSRFVHFDSKNNDNSCIILKVLKEGFRFKAKRLYNNFCRFVFVLFCNVYCVCVCACAHARACVCVC